jgi:invasion protein IalB
VYPAENRTISKDHRMKLSNRFVNRTGKIALAPVAALIMMMSSHAIAQNATQGERPPQPEWQKLCNENPKTKEVICVTTRQLLATTGQVLSSVMIQEKKDSRKLLVAVPPGMLIRQGLNVKIDGASEKAVTYSICVPNLCFGDVDITPDYVAAMKKGSELVVTATNQRGRQLNFNVSLAGFTKSYDGPGADPRKLQDDAKKLQEELEKKAEGARKKLIDAQQNQ